MKYIGISILIIINLMILFFSFLFYPYEMPEDKELGIISSESVFCLSLLFKFSIFINGLYLIIRFIIHLINKKIKILRWKADYLILAMLVFSIIECKHKINMQTVKHK